MSTSLGGYMGRVLRVDLTTREVSDYPWTDGDRRATLGGKVMAARILLDTLSADADPFGPDNAVVVSTGPLTGSGAPSTARFNVSALSPLTGTVGSSNCGGPFGTYLKKAGVDALVITGAADAPVWLEIGEGGVVTFHDAADTWGLTTTAAQEALVAATGARAAALVIGPAGENRVRYACLLSGDRAAGRTGLGAVFGSKSLKGIAAHGTAKVPIAKQEEFRAHIKKWSAALKSHPMTGEAMPAFGTGGFLPKMQALGVVATRNSREARFEDADAISGQTLAAGRLVGTDGCLSCPIRCGRVVEHEGRKVKGPELETLVLLGSNLGISDMDAIIEWNVQLDELGIDTMTAGGTIAAAMELAERGLAGYPVAFGSTEGIAALIDDIAYRRGVGDELAHGSRALATKCGAPEVAIQVKGLELAAYEPRRAIGHGLGYATSNRGGCHLNGGYMVALEGLALPMNGGSQASKHALAAMFQDLMEAVSAAGSCLFTTYAVFPGALVRGADGPIGRIAAGALSISGPILRGLRAISPGALGIPMPLVPHIRAVELVTGERLGFGRFWEVGERGFTLERLLGRRFGLTAKDDTLPVRMLEQPIDPGRPDSVVPLASMMRRYYAHRGWDAEGAPKAGLLRRLAIHD
ncbi:MAG: aldehyde ferredoxin oxidoreductase family protein [Coriobacteriia bacterium]|nr:aldehyde ferredoxin oxidoreductase family protein [Coriobacteriia bacterium]